MVYMPPGNEFQRRGSSFKAKAQLPVDGVMDKYRKFGLLYEVDVIKTCDFVLNDAAEKRVSHQILRARKFKEREENEKKDA